MSNFTGNGALVRNSIIFGGGGSSNHLTVTQAQYDALPQSEKEDLNKFYFITDGEGGGGGESIILPRLIISSEEECTIVITTPSGSTITPTSTISGVWECDINGYGEYTITATSEITEVEEVVYVDTVKIYWINISMIPDGEIVLPTNDIEMWLACAGIKDKSYSTLAEVLADSETFNALLGDSNACAYMARSTVWASLNGYVPAMTSNTTPSGVASASDSASNKPAYQAFDNTLKSEVDRWATSGSSDNAWIQYMFTEPRVVRAVGITSNNSLSISASVTSIDGIVKVQGTLDGTNWTDIETLSLDADDALSHIVYPINNSTAYAGIRMQFVSGNLLYNSKHYCGFTKLQFYEYQSGIAEDSLAMSMIGRYDVACDALLSDATWASAIANSEYVDSVLNVSVPTMTSNTAPSGVASANAQYDTNHAAWCAFDRSTAGWCTSSGTTGWIKYKFTESEVITYFQAINYGPAHGSKDFVIQGSNDDTNWEDLYSGGFTEGSELIQGIINNSTAYLYYRVNITSTLSSNAGVGLFELQFYGRTSSGEKVHGATDESAYILESGSPVTITDPSTLDAGTYTVYSRVAKDPANLSNDYSKTIRICPNTKEIVLMPDGALYWYGAMSNCEACWSGTGWPPGNRSWMLPTFNTTFVRCDSTSGTTDSAIGTTAPIFASKVYAVVDAKQLYSNEGGSIYSRQLKSGATVELYVSATALGMQRIELTITPAGERVVQAIANNGRDIDVYAFYYER